MSNCTLQPNVNNAVSTLSNYTSELSMATYQCLVGFSLSGDSRIYCNLSADVWIQAAPTCHVIQEEIDVDVNVTASSGVSEWFLHFLAFFLLLLLAAIIIIAICCFLRPPCRQMIYTHDQPVYTNRKRKDDNDEVFSLKSSRDSIFWVDKSEPTPREAPVYRKPVPPAKDLIKEGKWMPHRNSVREINTSTK